MSLAENELRNLYLGSSSTDDLEELETPDQFSDEIPVREHKKSAFRKVSVLAEEAEEDNEANAEDWEKTIQMRAREVSKMSVAEAGVLPVPGSPRVTIEQEEIVDDEPKVRFKSQVVLISHSDNEESILENPNKSRKELKKKDKKNKKTKKDEPKNVIKSPTNSKEFSSETRAKSILKRTVSPREKARIQLKHDEMQKAIAALRAGAVMTKFSQKGIPSKRYFKVSKDGTELKWKKPRGGFWTVFELAAVKLMIVGPRTQSFAGYDWKSKVPWNCFSLVADHRTVDIECHTQKDFKTWYFGLLSLIPLNFNNMDRPQVNWHVALYKTVQISLNCKKPVNDVWHILVDQAKSKTKTSSSIRDSERNQAKKDTKDRNVTSKFTKHLEIVRMAP